MAVLFSRLMAIFKWDLLKIFKSFIVFFKNLIIILSCGLISLMMVPAYAEVGNQLHDANGRSVKISDLQNKWIIINYWADWCESCLEEIPELNSFYQHNQDKNILLIGVNYDQLPQPYLKQAMQKTGIAFPVLLEDPKMLWQLGEITVLPTTFIINPHGDVVKKIIGPNTEESLLKVVHNRLAKKKSKKAVVG